LFLSSDTGGGHRASAESLAKQFQIHFPGSTYELLDIMSDHGPPPYNTLVPAYKHLSSRPQQWKLVYSVSNLETLDVLSDIYLKVSCESAIRKRIASYNPDVVVSVHPLMTKVPVLCCNKISMETEKHLPMFTVVTDLGSGHCLWFSPDVEKVFIASDQIRHLARTRGKVPEDKLVQFGLPIRHEFGLHAEELGDRMSTAGRLYRKKIKEKLGLSPERRTILVMGGGEGVGSLLNVVEALFIELFKNEVEATIVVICGRNGKLRDDFERKDWVLTILRHLNPLMGMLQTLIHGIPFIPNIFQSDVHTLKADKIQVIPLGFVSQMAEFMVAADVLISKAGPGTIAEAAALGLPVMLTSYLPGQEEGNVDFVVDGRFGAFRPDYEPVQVACEVVRWLLNENELCLMSHAAKAAGAPHAASHIARMIGESTYRWKDVNENSVVRKNGKGGKSILSHHHSLENWSPMCTMFASQRGRSVTTSRVMVS
jgi:1,2-diacylglycerol 3-beta-galactosyltransferase